jgi:hypothetical protein
MTEMSSSAMNFLIGIVLVGIALIFGLTLGVQIQQAIVTGTATANMTGLALFVQSNIVTFFMLIILAFGAGFVYKAIKGALE